MRIWVENFGDWAGRVRDENWLPENWVSTNPFSKILFVGFDAALAFSSNSTEVTRFSLIFHFWDLAETVPMSKAFKTLIYHAKDRVGFIARGRTFHRENMIFKKTCLFAKDRKAYLRTTMPAQKHSLMISIAFLFKLSGAENLICFPRKISTDANVSKQASALGTKGFHETCRRIPTSPFLFRTFESSSRRKQKFDKLFKFKSFCLQKKSSGLIKWKGIWC